MRRQPLVPEHVPHILVVGGGISGLSAALALRDLGTDVTLVEASSRFGGILRTERVDNLLIDAGPDSFLSTKPEGVQLVQRLGLEHRLINTRSDGGGTFILRKGKLVPLPEGLTLLVPTQFKAVARTPLLSPAGKLRLLMDYVIPARRDDVDESVGSFVKRRMGRQAFENMAEPLLSGIYAGDATKLSLSSTFPRLRAVECQHGSIIRGAIAQRRAIKTNANSRPPSKHTPFVSLVGGMGELIGGLVATLEECDLRTGIAVEGIHRQEQGYRAELSDGSDLTVDGVLHTTSAPVTAAIVEADAPELSEVLRQIPYVSSSTVSMAFDVASVAGKQGGRGFVIPRVEGRALTAVTWTSNKFAGRTPENVALLRGFVGRAGQEENAFLPEDELIDLVRRELAIITGITADPLTARVYRWPNAMPQYNIGHQERLDRIDRYLLSAPHLGLTGSAYRGVGIPDCIRNAQEQALALAARLQG
jgi:protoporphyrinogen/coproporphyrinogen III oxidase